MVDKRNIDPVVITEKCERIIKAVAFYRYMTAVDVSYGLFSISAIRRVREMLSTLCGGEDVVGNRYLYRFRAPSEGGNPERVYTLGGRGREFLREAHGIEVRWRMDGHLSYSQLLHNLLLTRVMVAARVYCRAHGEFELIGERICYEFPGRSMQHCGRKAGEGTMSVIPDGFLLFAKRPAGGGEHLYPVLLEADRGTMFRERFKRHVLSRVGFVASGEYERVFGTPAVMIAYTACGTAGQASEARRRSLCSWALEALREEGHEGWEQVFRFASVDLGAVYEAGLFEKKVWYRPDDMERPVTLFDG
jgi:hypothetical protein